MLSLGQYLMNNVLGKEDVQEIIKKDFMRMA